MLTSALAKSTNAIARAGVISSCASRHGINTASPPPPGLSLGAPQKCCGKCHDNPAQSKHAVLHPAGVLQNWKPEASQGDMTAPCTRRSSNTAPRTPALMPAPVPARCTYPPCPTSPHAHPARPSSPPCPTSLPTLPPSPSCPPCPTSLPSLPTLPTLPTCPPCPSCPPAHPAPQTVSNKGVWLLAFAYFFVYVVRQGATSWLVMARAPPERVAGRQGKQWVGEAAGQVEHRLRDGRQEHSRVAAAHFAFDSDANSMPHFWVCVQSPFLWLACYPWYVCATTGPGAGEGAGEGAWHPPSGTQHPPLVRASDFRPPPLALPLPCAQAKGASDAAHAAYTVSGLELGGLLGGSLAGVLTDMRIKAAIAAERKAPGSGGGYVGKRVQIVMVGGLASHPYGMATRRLLLGEINDAWLAHSVFGIGHDSCGGRGGRGPKCTVWHLRRHRAGRCLSYFAQRCNSSFAEAPSPLPTVQIAHTFVACPKSPHCCLASRQAAPWRCPLACRLAVSRPRPASASESGAPPVCVPTPPGFGR
eukprot:364769-Chlamydomonas_euryale.AAC.2